MTFNSILFPQKDTIPILKQETPEYFKDLNLDQLINKILDGREKYDLTPYFYTSISDEKTIRYRQEIMRDLEQETQFKAIKTFAAYIYDVSAEMRRLSTYLAKSDFYYNNYLTKGRLLNAADIYCKTIIHLMRDFDAYDIRSQGLAAFRAYISDYAESNAFTVLKSETEEMKAELSTVQYSMLIKGTTIRVRKFENEPDHTPEIEEIFQKFRQGAVKDYRKDTPEMPYAEHVEAGVLNLVAKAYPEIFQKLDSYCARHIEFIDQTLSAFSREVLFYIAYIEYIGKFKRNGLHFCYPEVSGDNKNISTTESFDMALADGMIDQGASVVCNDFYLKGNERIIIVTGPNQGGKTTFARVFGQLHHFASLGCLVAGSSAQLFLFDRIYTHFEKEEDLHNLSGKLQDDLIRMRDIIANATPNSIIIANEIFSSTTLEDAVVLGEKIMDQIILMGSLCVCVTFLDELAAYHESIVSMVSTVVPEDPVRRTYKIVRSPADGLAYAIHIAQKYRLTYDCLKERIGT